MKGLILIRWGQKQPEKLELIDKTCLKNIVRFYSLNRSPCFF